MIRSRWPAKACYHFCEIEAVCGIPVKSELSLFRLVVLYLEWLESLNELET